MPGITDPVKALKSSLDKLKLDYVDLYLIHAFKFDGISIEDAWKAMESAQSQGLAKAIGVSNFRVEDIERILKIAKVKPMVNQVELHPYLRK